MGCLYLLDNGERPVARKVLRYEIKQIITDAILNGELNPGDRIVETRIARELQVSQAPVREAIRELEQIGLVETKPYKGAFVNNICKNEVFEAYKLRSLIEGHAAREVANKIDGQILAEFEKLIEKMKESASNQERTAFIENDVAFHELIIKSTGSNLVYRVWSMIKMAHLPYLTLAKSSVSLHELVQEHRNINRCFPGKKFPISWFSCTKPY